MKAKSMMLAALCAAASVSSAFGAAFTPTPAQIAASTDKTASFGGNGVFGPVTPGPGSATTFHFVLGTQNGGQTVAAYDFPNPTSLAGFDSLQLSFTTTTAGISVKEFIQDRTTFAFIESGGAAIPISTTPTIVTVPFAQGSFTPGNVYEFGFQAFGPAGTAVDILVSPVPEPATLALLAAAAPICGLRRRRA